LFYKEVSFSLKGLFATILLLPALALAQEEFARPDVLQADIAFWRQIFGEITTNQALLHDSRHLSVVYEVVEIPETATPTRRRRIADLARDRYRKVLLKLASGERKSLNGEERRVLALWPAGVTDKELKEASKRIRFQQGLSDQFLAGLKRSGAWKAHIEKQLRAAGVPVELAALPHVESSFNPDAHSHVGAAGLWQFTRATGKRFMQIDYVVDERRDPFRASEAAAQLLAYNYSVLESWPLAITAYNHGVGGMRRAVKQLNTDDIGEINREYQGRTFGFASRNFYVAFLAALDVEQNADKYFGPVAKERPRADLIVKMPGFVAARDLSVALGITEDTLRVYNASLLDPVWDGTKLIPSGYGFRIPEYLTDKTVGQILDAIPTSQRYARQIPDMEHRIKSGESLSVIAQRYGTTTRVLMSLNGITNQNRIRAGQTLRLPFSGTGAPLGAESYTVRKGDSLSLIASRTGVSEASIMELNKLKDKNRIYVGQVLYLVPRDPSA